MPSVKCPGGTMTLPLDPWGIMPDATNDEAYAILSQDPDNCRFICVQRPRS